jgi:hypothetical protein
MRKIRGVFMAISVIALILVFIGATLSSDDCCEKPDSETQTLLASAERGDVKAIRTLYDRAVLDHVSPMIEHWALKGALAGDEPMRCLYLKIFRTKMELERQKNIVAHIRSESKAPGAALLLELLEGKGSDQCNS